MADDTGKEGTEAYLDAQGRTQYRKTGYDAAGLAVDKKMQGAGAGTKGSTAGMPQQQPGESPGAYGARLRKWREDQAAGQKGLNSTSGESVQQQAAKSLMK